MSNFMRTFKINFQRNRLLLKKMFIFAKNKRIMFNVIKSL